MAEHSGIEWTEATWNPLTGCTKVSAGCKFCYAERLAKRLQAMGSPNYRRGFELTMHEHMLELPKQWRKPRTIFVNSMSDLFHPQVPDDFVHRVFDVMVEADHHRYQVLTKRPDRVAEMSSQLPWPEHVWMGTSVEDQRVIERIDALRLTDARTRFLSLEPLLGPLSDLDLTGIHWVIVGGESGPKARPIKEEWVLEIRDQCQNAGVPFFFKQWGGKNKKRAGRLLEGRTWDGMPGSSGSPTVEQPSLLASVAD